MNRKKLFRNLAIVAVVLLALWGWSVMRNSDREYASIDTSVAMTQLEDKNVKSAQIDDREQRLRRGAQREPRERLSAKYAPGHPGRRPW